MSELVPYTPDSYSEVMRRSEDQLRFEADKLNYYKNQGDMFNIVRSETDQTEADRLLRVIQSTLSVDDANMHHIDVGSVITAMQLNIGRERFGIPDQEFEDQSPVENFFQYVFQGFGEDGKGWRVGLASRINESRRKMNTFADRIRLAGTPIGNFIKDLDIDLNGSEQRKIIVLHFPELVDHLEKSSDADFDKFDDSEGLRIRTFLGTLELMFRHQTALYQENPQGHVVVNMFDYSYFCSAQRVPGGEYLANKFGDITTAETPSIHEARVKMRNESRARFYK